MGEIINALASTPIPTVLIFAGLFFILLAFVSKVGGVLEVQPAQQKWSAPIGIALLVLGLILALNTIPADTSNGDSKPIPSDTSSPIEASFGDCAVFFSENAALTWKITDNGNPGNFGTLHIVDVNAATGAWIGDQITESKGGVKIRLSGHFDGTKMTLNHPNGAETWLGNCGDRTIEGTIQTTYPSQLTFEIGRS
ncbi:MAG: hypothetical protein WBA99_08845 [Nodosilinea sp.]